MEEKQLYSLKIEPKFRNLIPPLTTEEFSQLEANIRKDGCREPLTVWNGTIVDGHNRYAICRKYGIPFCIQQRSFESEEDAIAWICSNQIGRRNISEETRKYLIGKRYEAEKMISYKRNLLGSNQYTTGSREDAENQESMMRMHERGTQQRTAERLGEEYHISHSTVEKYGAYSKAIDAIGRKEPDLVPQILSGRYRISHNNLLDLSRQNNAEVQRFSKRLQRQGDPFLNFKRTRSSISRRQERPTPQPSVKDMPEFDPDADIAGLTLTVPSWTSSIERTKGKADLTIVSTKARSQLEVVLLKLKETIDEMLVAIKED